MKKIGIDCRFAGTHSGLGRYTRELVSQLLRIDSGIEWTLFVRSENEEWIKKLPTPSFLLPTPYPHYSLKEHIAFPKILKKSNIDLLFSPHFNVPYFCPVPTVITIHDLILHTYPNTQSWLKKRGYSILMKRALTQGKEIIAVSEFTASELYKYYAPLVDDKVTVIPEGVSEKFTRQSAQEIDRVRSLYDLQQSFFLYVGSAKQHKNVPMLLEAFEKSQSDSELILVTGGKEAQGLTLPPRTRRIETVDDADLPALYSAAKSFVTASLYEGFGLPVAEALSCGCPVIGVNRSAIPEVARGQALLVEPTMDALVKALQNPPLPPGEIPPYSWKEAAKETLDVLLNSP